MECLSTDAENDCNETERSVFRAHDDELGLDDFRELEKYIIVAVWKHGHVYVTSDVLAEGLQGIRELARVERGEKRQYRLQWNYACVSTSKM